MLIPCYGMYIAGQHGAFLINVLWWTILGYSFRFGRSYLYYGMFLIIAGFGSVIHYTPFWASMPGLSYGILIGLVFIPWMFVGYMLRRLTNEMARAEEASRAKSRFVANMSHEMRTPLNGIMGTVELISGTAMSSEQQEYVKTVKTSANALLSLVNDVLDISKIEEGMVTICSEEMDLHALIKDASSITERQIKAKGVAYRVVVSPSIPFLVFGDSHRIRQVLINLLSNATKFTEHGEICLRMLNAGEKGMKITVRFEVSDTGIGMTDEQRSKIFDRFVQADESTTRKYGGTGLGTTISKEIVSLMGGTIGVDSKEGEGSTFWFEIPLEMQDREKTLAEIREEIPKTDILLISSDNETAGTVIGSAVSWGLKHIERVSNEEHAFDRIARVVCDKNSRHVVIVDSNGSSEDPRNFASRFADSGFLDKVKMVFIGERRQFAGEEGLSKSGYSASIEAPVSAQELLHALHFVLPFGETSALAAASLSDAKTRRPMRILVADDNEINQMVIQRILERVGHVVYVVDNGKKALEALRNDRFDAAFLDLHMPVMGGIETAKRFLADAKNRKTPNLVALTADATVAAKTMCKEAGMSHYLPKPFEITTLLAILKDISSNQTDFAVVENLDEKETLDDKENTEGGIPLLDEQSIQQIESLGPTSEFAKNIVARFVDTSEQKIRVLENAFNTGDVASYCDTAHALRGAAGMMGALSVMDICSRMEVLRRNEDESQRRELLDNVRHEIAQTRKALIRRMNKTEAAAVGN